jgi:hypothetical protein
MGRSAKIRHRRRRRAGLFRQKATKALVDQWVIEAMTVFGEFLGPLVRFAQASIDDQKAGE